MNFAATFIPLLMPLAEPVKGAVALVQERRRVGMPPGIDVVSAYLVTRMQSWNPTMEGKAAVGPDEKTALARFLAGVILRLA